MEYGKFDVSVNRPYGSNVSAIQEFIAQSQPMARKKCNDLKSARSVRTMYSVIVKRKNLPVRVFLRGTTVYLEKEANK